MCVSLRVRVVLEFIHTLYCKCNQPTKENETIPEMRKCWLQSSSRTTNHLRARYKTGFVGCIFEGFWYRQCCLLSRWTFDEQMKKLEHWANKISSYFFCQYRLDRNTCYSHTSTDTTFGRETLSSFETSARSNFRLWYGVRVGILHAFTNRKLTLIQFSSM